jgi:hypothetical protein
MLTKAVSDRIQRQLNLVHNFKPYLPAFYH